MNNFPLPWLVPACLLSSSRLLDAALSASCHNLKQDRSLYHDAIKDFQGHVAAPLRQEDISFALSPWFGDEVKGDPDFATILGQISQHFLLWRGDRFEVKPSRLESWLALLSLIDPSWVIGFGYAALLEDKTLSLHQVSTLLKNQCPNALIRRFDDKPVADNHVHHGGHGHTSLSLASFILHLDKKPKQTSWPYRKEHCFFNANNKKLDQLPVLFHLIFESLLSNSLQPVSWEALTTYQVRPLACRIKYLSPAKDPHFELLRAAANNDGGASWLLLTTYACTQLLAPKKVQKKKLQTFIQTANIFRNYMVVSGVGLADFVDFFGFSHRKPICVFDYGKHSLFYDLEPHHLREFRVAKTNYDFYANIARAAVEKNIEGQIHFVYHFNRTFAKQESKDRFYQKARQEAQAQTSDLQKLLSSVTFDAYPIMDKHFKETKRVDLRAMLRGFDVAGNENDVPIEAFAPSLRILRSARHKHRFPHEKRLRQPFITLHAGEDFNHILTGLRAIDEAVTFCDFQPGDRIGHGLALGVDVYKWTQRQQCCYLPLQTHLDNLVWCHQQACLLAVNSPQFQPMLPLLEGKIARFSHALYEQSYLAQTLYQAWQLRQNCPLTNIEASNVLGDALYLKVPDADEILAAQKNIDSAAKMPYTLWRRYLKAKRHDIDKEKIVMVRYSQTPNQITKRHNTSLEDEITPAELALFHGIQDMMLERFSLNHWTLEACPTSNIYIGRLDCYHEHPIFRWDPPKHEDLAPGGKANVFGIRNGPVHVCINTDDAGLMPTNLENEHGVIKECAISHFNVSAQEAEQWINKIKEHGVSLFKGNHLNWSGE